MTLSLHLGIVDIPYKDGDGKTTGEVADILEKKYHVFTIFYEAHKKEIISFLIDGQEAAIETMIISGRKPDNLLGEAASQIESMFRKFLESQEFERLSYGDLFAPVPTKAALRGVNHRLKHPYAKENPRRPSLIDTGLFENNFAVWLEENVL